MLLFATATSHSSVARDVLHTKGRMHDPPWRCQSKSMMYSHYLLLGLGSIHGVLTPSFDARERACVTDCLMCVTWSGSLLSFSWMDPYIGLLGCLLLLSGCCCLGVPSKIHLHAHRHTRKVNTVIITSLVLLVHAEHLPSTDAGAWLGLMVSKLEQ